MYWDMKRKISIISILAVFILLFILFGLYSNVLKSYGKAEIKLNKHKKYISDLDTIQIWCPYNYSTVDWQVFFHENGDVNFGSKGCSFGNHVFGSFMMMNNHLSTSLLNIDSLNKKLQKINLETPQLIWYVKYKENDSTIVKGYQFLMFTKDEKLYDNKKKLIDLTHIYLKNEFKN